MNIRIAFALSLLALSTTPALAQYDGPRERYDRLRYACDRGDRHACVEMGRAQEEYTQHLRRACDQGDRRACVTIGRVEEHRHEEWHGDRRNWDQH